MEEGEALSNAEIISNDTFKRIQARKSRKIFFRSIFYVVIALTVCAVFISICVYVFFNIKNVTVINEMHEDPEGRKITYISYETEDIIEAGNIEMGSNMYSINKKNIEYMIKLSFPYVKEVNIRRKLPSDIEIELIEDEPYYYIVISGEYFVLSNSLRVLERTETRLRLDSLLLKNPRLIELELPAVKYAFVGSELKFRRENDFKFVLALLNLFETTDEDIYNNISKINISNRYKIYFIYDDDFKVAIGKNENFALKLSLAKEIMKYLKDQRAVIDVGDISVNSALQVGQEALK